MAVRPVATDSVTSAPKRKAAPRPVGPREAWLLFKPGTDPSLVQQLQSSLQIMTFDGRAILSAMSTGEAQPFVKVRVTASKRGPGAVDATSHDSVQVSA